MITSKSSDFWLILLRVESTDVEHFEGAVAENDTDFVFGVDSSFSDMLLFELLFMDGFEDISEVVIEEDSLRSDEDDIVFHGGCFKSGGKAVAIVE